MSMSVVIFVGNGLVCGKEGCIGNVMAATSWMALVTLVADMGKIAGWFCTEYALVKSAAWRSGVAL